MCIPVVLATIYVEACLFVLWLLARNERQALNERRRQRKLMCKWEQFPYKFYNLDDLFREHDVDKGASKPPKTSDPRSRDV